MQLGNNIQTLRKKKGLSQEKLAEKINVTRQTISNWELGETAPNPEQLILLSKQFDISIDELVGNDAMSSGSSFNAVITRSIPFIIEVAEPPASIFS